MTHLLVLVVDNLDQFPDILTAWEEIGVPGITVLESLGSRRVRDGLRDDLPLLISLRAVLEMEETHNRTLFCIIDSEAMLEKAIQAAERIVGDFSRPHTGILFTVPVDRALGIMKAKPHRR